MTAEELRAIMTYLEQRVLLGSGATPGDVTIDFQTPNVDEMVAAGLDAEGSQQVLGSPWWGEMVEDIVDTPDMCEPGDSPDKVLRFARDVVSEYVRKRYTP